MKSKKYIPKYEPERLYRITWHASKVFKGSEVEEKLKVLAEKKIIHWAEIILKNYEESK